MSIQIQMQYTKLMQQAPIRESKEWPALPIRPSIRRFQEQEEEMMMMCAL